MGNVGSKNWVRDDCPILLFNTGTVSALIYTEYIMFSRFWDLVVLTLWLPCYTKCLTYQSYQKLLIASDVMFQLQILCKKPSAFHIKAVYQSFIIFFPKPCDIWKSLKLR